MASTTPIKAGAAGYRYPIGVEGLAWGAEEKISWKLKVGTPLRSYQSEVLDKLEPLKSKFDVSQYGSLSYNGTYDETRFPLFAIKYFSTLLI